MDRITDVWDRLGHENEKPFFGWLNASLLLYPSTINLKTRLHLRPIPTVPFVELEPTDHPLAIEQRQGMPIARVIEVVQAYSTRH